MVLLFTQSRGTTAGVGIESSVEKLLLDPHLPMPPPGPTSPRRRPAAHWPACIGSRMSRRPTPSSRPGATTSCSTAPAPCTCCSSRTRPTGALSPRPIPDVWIAFDTADDGKVSAMRTFFGKRVEHDPRHPPAAGLPTLAQVVAMVGKAHHIERVGKVGGVRLSGSIDYVNSQIEGFHPYPFDDRRSRSETNVGGVQQTVMTDGIRAGRPGPRRAWMNGKAARVSRCCSTACRCAGRLAEAISNRSTCSSASRSGDPPDAVAGGPRRTPA